MNTKEILFCGQLCAASYNNSAMGFINVDDLRYGIRDMGDTVYIVFRGTANTKNTIRDITVFPPVMQDGFLTHRGFAMAVRKLLPFIKAQYSNTKVVFTGHSFGAAVAALFANHYNCSAITFGCPAIHFWFAPKPNINHTRIVCDDDPVPMIPLLTGKHTCPPALILKDSDDEWIDVEDHAISVYNKRLSIWAAQQKEASNVG